MHQSVTARKAVSAPSPQKRQKTTLEKKQPKKYSKQNLFVVKTKKDNKNISGVTPRNLYPQTKGVKLKFMFVLFGSLARRYNLVCAIWSLEQPDQWEFDDYTRVNLEADSWKI